MTRHRWCLGLALFLLSAGVGVAATDPIQRAAAPGRAGAPASPAVPPPERFTVQSDGHAMAVWARRPAAPKGTVLLVHGRTWSSRPDFDLQVPGLQRSVMQSFVAHGYAAYAVDLRGYGETPRDATGWLTPRRGTADIVNVLSWIASQHPALPRPALVGWSRGAGMAAMAASAPASAARMSALVLFGFAFDPEAQFIDVTVSERPMMEKNTAEAAASDFISPKITPPAVVRAFVEQALKADPVLMDLKNDAEFNAIKVDAIKVPTLLLFGEDDPGVLQADAGKFFAALGTGDKQMVSLPGADHAAQIEDTHDAWIAAIVSFLNRPAVRR
jgi:alpha-beta hydrolase superfamily lysophospholipase